MFFNFGNATEKGSKLNMMKLRCGGLEVGYMLLKI
jgi:hypothetical protein